MFNKLLTLGIETSCDETGVSLYNNENGILSEYTYSQQIHTEYGGTVPELASRDHIKKLANLVIYTLKNAKKTVNDLNGIAYTKGPGLSGSLLVGSSFAKSLAMSLSIPSVGINHLEAHLFTLFLFNKIKFPCLAVLISGAHTIIFKLYTYNSIEILGETLDDSVGETFDKVARFLKLRPINGKSIENLSKNINYFKHLDLPKPFYKSKCYNFSFSGLKTKVLTLDKENKFFKTKSNLSYNFQNTVIKIIINKCKKIIENNDIKSILISGGVSSNNELRIEVSNLASALNIESYFSPSKYCMDNGTMVAFLGFIKLFENCFDRNLSIDILPRMKFDT